MWPKPYHTTGPNSSHLRLVHKMTSSKTLINVYKHTHVHTYVQVEKLLNIVDSPAVAEVDDEAISGTDFALSVILLHSINDSVIDYICNVIHSF